MKCRERILPNATENWYIILYDLVSRLWYNATSGPFCKDASHMVKEKKKNMLEINDAKHYI